MEIDLRVQDSPWNRRIMMSTISRRNICRVLVDGEEHDLIISAIYVDKDGIEWLQGVNVSDIVDKIPDPNMSNIIVQISKVELIEFKDKTVYDLELTADQASSIMRRTDKIVRLARDGATLIEEAERVGTEPKPEFSKIRIAP